MFFCPTCPSLTGFVIIQFSTVSIFNNRNDHAILMDPDRRSLLEDALTELDLYREYIYRDIQKAIKSRSNYLAALGLSTFTEVFGGFYRGDLSQGNSANNYNEFIKEFFPKPYSEIDDKLRGANLKGLYKQVRCGLVHEYLIGGNFMVIRKSRDPLNCGIVFIPKLKSVREQKSKHDHLVKFVIEQYFEDFKGALNCYISKVKNDEYLLAKFECALNSIESPLARRKKIKGMEKI